MALSGDADPTSPDEAAPQADPPPAVEAPATGEPATRKPASRKPTRKTTASAPAERAARSGSKRSTRAAPAREPAAPPERVQAVVFSLAEDEYALPIDQVREVIAFREPRSVASATSWLRGVINLRGIIVPVCDLAARLGRDGGRAPSAKIVIVEAPTGAAGLIVDSVREVLTVAPEQLDRVTFTSDTAVTAIANLGERLVVMLDAPAVLAEANLQDIARRSG